MGPSDSQGVLFNTRHFHLDEDALPGTTLSGSTPFLNHGRQVARNRLGRWICCFAIDRNRPLPVRAQRDWCLMLAVSDGACSQGADFPDPIRLVGRSGALFSCEGDSLGNACALLDGGDRLHIVFEQGNSIYHLSADVSGDRPRLKLSDAENWTGPVRIAGAGSQLGDALIDPSGRCTVYCLQGSMLVEHPLDERAYAVCDGVTHPVVHVDAKGTTHLAFERDRRIFYLRQQAGSGAWTDTRGNANPEMVAYFCCAWGTNCGSTSAACRRSTSGMPTPRATCPRCGWMRGITRRPDCARNSAPGGRAWRNSARMGGPTCNWTAMPRRAVLPRFRLRMPAETWWSTGPGWVPAASGWRS